MLVDQFVPPDVQYTERGRPIVKVPWTFWQYVFFGISVLAAITSIILYVNAENNLPAEIPTHWNSQGEVTSVGSKGTLIMYPLICIGFATLLNLVANYPYHMNMASITITVQNCKDIYPLVSTLMRYIGAVISTMMVILMELTYQSAMSGSDSSSAMPIVLVGMFGSIIAGVVVLVIKLGQYRTQLI